MKLWTIQTKEFYDVLQKNGVVYCDRESCFCKEYREMYDWMADEMRKRIGNPPNPVVRYPLWAWYQYTSRKKPKPPVSPSVLDSDQEEGVILEIEIPDNEVLLSASISQQTRHSVLTTCFSAISIMTSFCLTIHTKNIASPLTSQAFQKASITSSSTVMHVTPSMK